MRLKSVYIGQYKNLQNFELEFDGDSFIDVFVGKNGTGKSNLFEALIAIFRHLYEFDKGGEAPDFDYRISFEIDNKTTELSWEEGRLTINGKARKKVRSTPLPDNVLIYYSGHNEAVSELISKYEDAFSKRIIRADFDESRSFIGIGSDYKELLLAFLLMQEDGNPAKEFICQKLGVTEIGHELRLVFDRPIYANDDQGKPKSDFNIINRDADRYWKAEGVTKDFLAQLSECISVSGDSPVRSEGYFEIEDRYILYFDIQKIRETFAELSAQELFRRFDNLKTLGMLSDTSISLTLSNGSEASVGHFSDGQFQTIYIYAVSELFKDQNCITLLDEPDAFLHPEWQFDFLKQVFEITAAATQSNHVLMSSHSASTITTAKDEMISLFTFEDDGISVSNVKKADVIKSLSAGLITFSESEARMNIQHVLKSTTLPVLFTEGITDEMTLETAWDKLNPGVDRPFEIQNAFDCSFLRNLVKRDALYNAHPGRTFFALFDFDEAYNDWSQLGQDVQIDPNLCLTKKRDNDDCYALLLPVPADGPIRNQVINQDTGDHYGNRSLLTTELLFYGADGLDGYFVEDTSRPGNFIKFVSDGKKVEFARDVIPGLDRENFEAFRPIFDFVTATCAAG